MKKAEVKKGKKKNALKENTPLYLMMLPALLYLLINNYIPMAGMVIAFKKLNFAKGIWASPWAGLDTPGLFAWTAAIVYVSFCLEKAVLKGMDLAEKRMLVMK